VLAVIRVEVDALPPPITVHEEELTAEVPATASCELVVVTLKLFAFVRPLAVVVVVTGVADKLLASNGVELDTLVG
jgi:hypothetical protein